MQLRSYWQLPAARQTTNRVLFAGACAGAAWIALGAGDTVGIIAGCVLVLLVCAPTAWRLRRDPLDPPAIYMLLSGLCYGVPSLTWIGEVPPVAAPGVGPVDVAEALVLVAGGLAAFGVVARLVAGPVRPRPLLTGGESESVPVLLVVGLFSLGLVGVVVGHAIGTSGFNTGDARATGVPAYGQAFLQLGLLGALAAGALALWVFRRPTPGLRRLLFALVAAQVLTGFASGYKQQALLPVLLVGAAYVSCCGRIPWKAVAVGAATSILLLLPATIIYRNSLQSEGRGAPNVRTPAGLFHKTTDYLNVRFRLIDSVAIIRARTPDRYPYANGRRYTLLPMLIAVPRAVWVDKPILNDGLEFSHTYWEIPPSVITATPLTQPGDLYRNFGGPGVLIGVGLWGALVGALARVNAGRRSPRLELVCLVALVQVVPFVDSDLPQLVAGASRTLAVAGVVAWLTLPGSARPAGFTRLLRTARRQWARRGRDPRLSSSSTRA